MISKFPAGQGKSFETETGLPRRAVLLAAAGLALMLAAFLEPFLPLLGRGAAAVALFVPARFLWTLYLPGAVLLAAGLIADVKLGAGSGVAAGSPTFRASFRSFAA